MCLAPPHLPAINLEPFGWSQCRYLPAELPKWDWSEAAFGFAAFVAEAAEQGADFQGHFCLTSTEQEPIFLASSQ